MTPPATRWRLPNGRDAIELPGSTRDVLVLAEIMPNWPFPAPAREHARVLCTRIPSQARRVGAAMPAGEEARW